MRTECGATLLEIIAVMVLIAIFVALIMPTLTSARESASRTQCAQTIRSMLTAMYMYADSPSSNNYLPTRGTAKDSFAQTRPASEALQLLYRQYVNDPRVFVCPKAPNKPSTEQLMRIRASDAVPPVAMSPADSSYSYDPGHTTNTSSMVALISDDPINGGNSNNHGPGAGQNVGFGTSVEFRESVRNTLGDGVTDQNIFP